jgi:hypothetical protein
MHKRVRENVVSLFNIEIYISSPFFLFVRHKKNDVRQLPLNQKKK